MMSESVIMNIRNDASGHGEARTQPFIIWLQVFNFAMITAVCWILLKVYRSFYSFFEWMFPFQQNTLHQPVVLVIGNENNLNDEMVRQLSRQFRSSVVRLRDANDNVRPSEGEETRKESRIIYTQLTATSHEAIARLSSSIRSTYGEIDLLVISQSDEPAVDGGSPHAFLNTLNKQLLTQFWIVMAFLPGMLQRNSGHIISIAQGRNASLTNTGIVRSVCEELLLSDTNVNLKLVERNSFAERYLPTLPDDLLAHLIIRSMWTSSSFIQIPSVSQYLVMFPILVGRTTTQMFFTLLNMIGISSGSE